MSKSAEVSHPPRGWYPDPSQPHRERYWDGTRWTQVVRQTEVIEPRRVMTGGQVPQSRIHDPARDLPLAGWWRRFGSGVADTVIAWVLTIVVVILADPGFLPRLGAQYMAYVNQASSSWLAGAKFPTPPVGLTTQLSTLIMVLGGVTAVYCIVFLGTWGATLGHRLCGIKVIKAPLPLGLLAQLPDKPFAEEKPGWLRAMSKGLSWALVSAGGGVFVLVQIVNILLPLWHRRKQSVTDLFANTLTVRDQKGTPPPAAGA